MKRVVSLVAALVVTLSAAVKAQDGLPLELDRADVERGDAGVTVVVAGGLPSAPDRTRVRVASDSRAPGGSFSTSDTQDCETPAARATSTIVGAVGDARLRMQVLRRAR